jgi:hypothetical protein
VSPGFTRLSLLAQTTYARLVDVLLASEAGTVPEGASLVSKRIKGHTYWYVQRVSAGKKSQTYLGPESPELHQLVERWRRARAAAVDHAELVALARAGGLHVVTATEAKVFAQLAPAFRIGGVLVGSHAFAVIGNLLGVHWQDAVVRTEDIDLAHDTTIAVAMAADIAPVSLTDDLDAVPLFSVLDPTSPATTFQVRGTSVQVDLLTPLVGRERDAPVPIPALRAAAMPLRFLDYVIEETQPAAVVGGEGTLVNVPRPGRFALHKLLVAGRRSSATRAKVMKDRLQASALLQVLLADLPGELTLAWKALVARGRTWTRAARESIAHLEPELVEQLRKHDITPLKRRS